MGYLLGRFVPDSVSLSFTFGEGAPSRSKQQQKKKNLLPSVTCPKSSWRWLPRFCRGLLVDVHMWDLRWLMARGCFFSPILMADALLGCASLLETQTKIALLFSFRYKSDDYSDLNIIQLSTSVRFISFLSEPRTALSSGPNPCPVLRACQR